MANPGLYEPMQNEKLRIMMLSNKKRDVGLSPEEEAELQALLLKIRS